MYINLTETQDIWVRRVPLLSVLFTVFVLPLIVLAWYAEYDIVLGILACYGMVGLTWLIPFSVEWYEKSNELSTKQKAIIQQQLEDADEWNVIYKKYCRDIGQPQRPQPKPYQQQQQADRAWERTYRSYSA